MPLLDAPALVDVSDPSARPDLDTFSIRARLARIMQGGDFPALSREVIDTITTVDDEGSSLQGLANIVLREYGLTLSVIRTANSAHYRRGGRATESATHAMMMLGGRVVRQLAGSMMLFEHFQRRSPELRTLMVRSLLTANHARATALALGLEHPEVAHLRGMLHNLGEVLVACYFHDDYRRIHSLVHDDGRSEDAARRMVLGFAYRDFGVEVASEWGLPESVTQSMRAEVGQATSVDMALPVFSDALTNVLYGANRGGTALDALLVSHKAHVKLTGDEVARIASDALRETREILLHTGAPDRQDAYEALVTSARGVLGTALRVVGEESVSTLPGPDVTTRGRLRLELEELVDPTSEATIGTVLLQALEVILRGGPFDRVVVCFMTADRQQLVARTGLGVDVDALVAAFNFPVSTRGGPVVTLTQQRQPVYLPADRALTATESRWADAYGVAQFGVFPLIVMGKVIGCVYCDRLAGKPAPDRATVRFTKSIADLVIEAIARRRT